MLLMPATNAMSNHVCSPLQIVFAVLGGWGIGIYTAMKVCSKDFLMSACPY